MKTVLLLILITIFPTIGIGQQFKIEYSIIYYQDAQLETDLPNCQINFDLPNSTVTISKDNVQYIYPILSTTSTDSTFQEQESCLVYDSLLEGTATISFELDPEVNVFIFKPSTSEIELHYISYLNE